MLCLSKFAKNITPRTHNVWLKCLALNVQSSFSETADVRDSFRLNATEHQAERSMLATGQRASSEDLVPGDLVDLTGQDLTTFPADFVLLSGEVIVNESMLTGESVPVSKTPLEEAAMPSIALGGDLAPNLVKHVVFCGTKVVRVRKTPIAKADTEAVGMVLRTGFNTTKGYALSSFCFGCAR